MRFLLLLISFGLIGCDVIVQQPNYYPPERRVIIESPPIVVIHPRGDRGWHNPGHHRGHHHVK